MSEEFILADFEGLKITLASPETIRSWSYGEVTKPETINYRTQKPERDGLFCERIFGPVRDYECNCGKYKKIRFKGTICDRCGVEVTTSLVRRERMGHIELATPVAHFLFYQVPPSKMGLLLDYTINEIQSILNYEVYVVIEPGDSPYQMRDLIEEKEYLESKKKYDGLVAATGAEALEELLKRIDLDRLAAELKARIPHEQTRRFQLLRRLQIVEAFKNSGIRPEWMILHVIPVIPPDLRPLVTLEGGRFASADLNDLYKRVIIRNNRLKLLLSTKTPDVILKYEKRLLQEAVNALFSNESISRPIMGKQNRPLKSLCESLRGKQGRFRRNLLGKRVDYSGRSVIVVDPTLKLHQCALPKEMAYELFKPMVMRKLEEMKVADSQKSAKALYKRASPEVWEALVEVTKNHPVLLNRAPTLHRVSIQAFYPVLVEHRAIGIHPLVCPPFNADFDGDTMSCHVPLTPEAILEAATLLLSCNNILSPAHGKPLMTPTQDIVAGIYFITKEHPKAPKIERVYDDFAEIISGYELGEFTVHTKIKFRYNGITYNTTVGRVILNEILPEELRFVNEVLNKDKLNELVDKCYRKLGSKRTAQLLDDLKDLGFEMATRAGISLGIDDIIVPKEKERIIKEAEAEVKEVLERHRRGYISDSERYNMVVTIWNNATQEIENKLMEELEKSQDGFNPLFLLIDSGARGSKAQAVQIGGMRGLMAKPQRGGEGEEVIETPIKSSFQEGLSVWEYFISTRGGRKGLTDTALKTAEAGYLTRRLVDVAQEVVITMEDCGTILKQEVTALKEGGDVIEPLSERIIGRIAAEDIINPITKEIIVKEGEEIDEEKAKEIEDSGIEKVAVRSVLTCQAPNGLCAKCYGRNLATGKLVDVGEAVGIIAAQSIGEPGTQLTLRTFHVGGMATHMVEQNKATARFAGKIIYQDLKTSIRSDGQRVALSPGKIELSENGRKITYDVPKGAVIKVADKDLVKEGQELFEWEPYSILIIAEYEGEVRYKDIELGRTLQEDIDERVGRKEKRITEDREKELHPRLEIVANNEVVKVYELPNDAYLVVEDKQKVKPGDILARLVREVIRAKDITGGLPKVAELFEAKRVKDPAIISEIDGRVEVYPPQMGMRIVKVISEDGKTERSYKIPYGKYLLVKTGDVVKAGDKLCEGEVDPHDVLKVKGWMAVQEFLTNRIQEVYRLQNVKINDKHISIIVRQMLKKVKIEDAGDSSFMEGQIVDAQKVDMENQRLVGEHKRPAKYTRIILGITRAALLTDSWLSAASFQETTRVISEAAIEGRVDYLRGLKENVIVGRLIPAGTGFREFKKIKAITKIEEIKEVG
ncbi:MAG: DNA-directed RNA polymerase subunit beta' [candidate division WOR-3 bacterium]|uniref:DNA-directed RNA polymerase subunit beta' n=1 Tax=candidate division WOR-3 bacterium TaxID=2052148 RepID=A0A7C4VYS9_UNCW3